jgi:aspartate kinase
VITTDSIIVMKFGGSSLATEDLRVLAARRVIETVESGKHPIVVVSAMGRLPAPYATDTLLALAPGADGANLDLRLACGESMSAAIFASLLEARGVKALALTGAQAGILTEKRHGDARILRVEPQLVREQLEAGVTPVIAGFQGLAPDGSVTTLGRGGTDLTAVAIAAALGNATCEIYTDVEGVMTADPRRLGSARTVRTLTFEEVNELAANGAQIMHDRATDLAREARTPYSIRSLRSGSGTDIAADRLVEPGKPVTGIAVISGFTFLHVVPEAAALPGGWERDTFTALAKASVNLDCINVNLAGAFFIVKESDLDRTRRVLDALPVAARATRDCAKISIVGAGMRGTPGIMAAIVQALVGAGVPIIHSTDSNITISVLVPGSLAAAAEATLHKHFELA